MTTRFSWITDPSAIPSSKPWDSVLAQSRNFAALPSLGSLVPGWTLIVPKRSMLSLAQLSLEERTELRAFRGTLRRVLAPLGGKIFELEHGAARAGSLAGCGVDQAHLHLVPLDFDLIECLDRRVTGAQFKRLSAPSEDVAPSTFAGLEYLWCSDGVYESRVGSTVKSESQWFRRLIAKQIGLDEAWDYSKHHFEKNIRRTLALFGSK